MIRIELDQSKEEQTQINDASSDCPTEVCRGTQRQQSHSGLNMTWGLGSPISASRKQKLSTTSSATAELVAANEVMGPMMWTKLSLQEQGHNPTALLMQDNTSAIKLERNGKASSGKNTGHLNIRCFCIKDLLDKGEFDVECCPTEDMQADFLAKSLQGESFHKMFKWLMGIERGSSPKEGCG